MRNKVRLIVIPCANPAGFVNMTRGNGNVVVNENGVDLNRNFTYGWNLFVSGTTTYKGSAPLSEKESQYIDAVMSLYASEGATAYVDIHNTGVVVPDVDTAHYYAPVPLHGITARNLVHEIIYAVSPVGFTVGKNVQKNVEPISVNQAANNYNLHAISVEWEPGAVYGKTYNTAEDVTEGLKFIGNVILRLISMQSAKMTSLREPWVVEIGNGDTSLITNVTAGTWEDLPKTQFVFTPKCDGILIVNTELTFHNTTVASQNFATMVVLQSGNGPIAISTEGAQQTRHEIYTEPGGKRDSLALNRAVRVFAKDDSYGDVTIKTMWKCDVGRIAHRRSRLYITFIPTDTGNAYEIYYTDASQNMTRYYPGVIS